MFHQCPCTCTIEKKEKRIKELTNHGLLQSMEPVMVFSQLLLVVLSCEI